MQGNQKENKWIEKKQEESLLSKLVFPVFPVCKSKEWAVCVSFPTNSVLCKIPAREYYSNRSGNCKMKTEQSDRGPGLTARNHFVDESFQNNSMM